MCQPPIHHCTEPATTPDLLLLEKIPTPGTREVNTGIGTLDVPDDFGTRVADAETAAVEVVVPEDVEEGLTEDDVHHQGI